MYFPVSSFSWGPFDVAHICRILFWSVFLWIQIHTIVSSGMVAIFVHCTLFRVYYISVSHYNDDALWIYDIPKQTACFWVYMKAGFKKLCKRCLRNLRKAKFAAENPSFLSLERIWGEMWLILLFCVSC